MSHIDPLGHPAKRVETTLSEFDDLEEDHSMLQQSSNPSPTTTLPFYRQKIPVRGRYKRMLKTQNRLLSQHVHRRANKDKQSHVGKKTEHNRRSVINAAFDTLFKLGFHLEDVHNFTVKHERALLEHWTALGQRHTPGTLGNYCSVMHTFGQWIDKPFLFKDPRQYLSDPSLMDRTYIADSKKYQDGVGQADIPLLLREATERDERFGCLLALITYWGLRSEEAMKFHPHTVVVNGEVKLECGTKGGRPRELHELMTREQQAVMAWAKSLAPTTRSSMIPAGMSEKKFNNQYRTHLKNLGMTKKGRWGFTPHNLRQLKLVDIYIEETGGLPPVAGGVASDVTREQDIAARQVVAEYAGHGRLQVSTAYIGAIVTAAKRKRPRQKKKE